MVGWEQLGICRPRCWSRRSVKRPPALHPEENGSGLRLSTCASDCFYREHVFLDFGHTMAEALRCPLYRLRENQCEYFRRVSMFLHRRGCKLMPVYQLASSRSTSFTN